MRALTVTFVSAALLACCREPRPGLDSRQSAGNVPDTSTAARATAVEGATASSYPPGRWRLVPLAVLSRTLIRLSHILVRHDGVREGIVSFQLPDWTPAPPPPARTAEHARALAEQIAARLQKSPNEFATVARELSEDVATQHLGGALGLRSAAEFFTMPEVLDAIAALQPGEVSRVVETEYGFHILQTRAPLPEETVSGTRILIAHDQAPWLGMFLARGPLPARSREEAMRLAQSLYERAKAGEPVEKLARDYSDHREAVRGGDFGAWSTRESTPFPREMEILASIEVGGIHPPVDTPFGVAVMQRVANRPRQALAMTSVQLRVEPRAAAADPTSREWVMKNIRGLSEEIAKDPSKFVELQKQYCCVREEHWVEGRGEAEAEAMLARLKPGAISREPVTLPGALGIVKRIEPRPVKPPEFSFELPAPKQPDIPHLVSSGRLRVLLRGFAPECARALGLEPSIASQLVALLDGMVNGEEVEHAAAATQFAQLQERARALLDDAQYQRYLELLTAHVENGLLTARSPSKFVKSGTPVAASK